MEEEVVYEALSVQKGKDFSCPFCLADAVRRFRQGDLEALKKTTRYVIALNEDHKTFVARPLNGMPCEHLNPQIRLRADGRWEVRFATPVEENAPLGKKVAYLLNSAGPFHAWLARKEPWQLVGKNGPGDQSPIARFLAESLRPSYDRVWAWVGRDASVFVGVKSKDTESGDTIFIPDPRKLWLHEFVWFVWERGEGKMWTAREAIEIIELVNVLSTKW
jgi:hypothetical protein